MSCLALLQSTNSTALSLDTVKKNKYTALSGVWKYLIPQRFIDNVLQCEKLPEVCRANFKNNIADKLKNGELLIRWTPTKVGFGRYYSGVFVDGISVGSMSSQMRQIKNSYYHSMGWIDFDFVKCHPALIVQIIEKSGVNIDCEPMKKYITRFDEFADQMIAALSADSQNPLTHDNIKSLITAHIYGGGFNTWADECERGDEKYGKLPIPVIRTADARKKLFLYQELRKCIDAFTTHVNQSNILLQGVLRSVYPDYTHDKLARTLMSYYLQTFEHECLFQAYQICVKKGYIEKKTADLCYDGFTAKIITSISTDDLLRELNAELAKKTGFDMCMVAKPLKDVLPELCFETGDISEDVRLTTIKWGEAITPKRIADRFLLEFGENICWAINGSAKRVYVYYIDKNTKIGRWYDETEEKNRYKISLYLSEKLWDIMMPELQADEPRIDALMYGSLVGGLRGMLLGKSSSRNDVIAHILASCREEKDIFDKNPNLLGFNNGVIDLPTRTFREYKYDDYMTLTTGYNYNPVDYSIPRNIELRDILKQIWADVQPNQEQKMLYIQSLAAALDGRQYQKLFLFTGEGGNGKGLTNSLMKRVLGCAYAYDAPSAILKDFENKASNATPLLYNLKDKRYVVFTEVKGLISTAIIKKITGGDHVTARMLHQNPTSFKLSSIMFMEFNTPPDLDGLPQEAEYRRVLYIDFPHNFTDDADKVGKTINGKTYLQANPYYASDAFLEEMAPVFLDTLLHAYCYYYDEEQQGIKFDIPECVRQQTDKFFKNQNPLRGWLEEHYETCDIPLNNRGNPDFNKCVKQSVLWQLFESSELYKALPKQLKRELSRSKVYEYLENNYECRGNKDKNQFVVNIREKNEYCYHDNEEDEEDEEVSEE